MNARWRRASAAVLASRLYVVQRAVDWKMHVEASLANGQSQQGALVARQDVLAADHAALVARQDALAAEYTALVARQDALVADYAALVARHDALAAGYAALVARHDALVRQHESLVRGVLRKFHPQSRLLAIRKGLNVTLLPLDPALVEELAGFAPSRVELMDWSGAVDMRWTVADRQGTFLEPDGHYDWPTDIADSLRRLIQTGGTEATAAIWRHMITSDTATNRPSQWPHGFRPGQADADVRRRRLMIALGVRDPALVPVLHAIEAEGMPPEQYPPFGEDPGLTTQPPSRVPAEPRKRSVLFVNPAYYNFLHLADALRKRGWDAVSMANRNPDDAQTKYFHGFDLNFYDPDPLAYRQRLRTWFQEAIGRFDMFHFHGIGTMSFFPDNWDDSIDLDRISWDVLEMKRRGAKIAYTLTGCHDLITQTGFGGWSPTMCPKCVFRDQPNICSDQRMAAWGWKVRQLADLICIETDPPLDYRDTPQTFREPLSFAVDPVHWHPDLARTIPVPDEWHEPRDAGELLIYHSVGNYEERSRNGVNVKGTGAVIRAIDRLRGEGHPVRLLFRTDVPSIHNRWMLAQADIIVDQLNYGRYGATAREGLMLGRPVVGRMNKAEPGGIPPVRCIAESPIVDASEETVYAVLKRLVENPDERARIGEQSRAHAVQWWSKDVLAERYERVYDHLHAHGRPPVTLD
jgi:hypothetical protein